MNAILETTPEEIKNLCQRCQKHIKNRFGVELDFSNDTISMLDHHVNAILAEENKGEIPLPGTQIRTNLVNLFAPTLGAYFGTTLAAVFGANWRFVQLQPEEWRLDFSNFFLRFNPVAAAACVIAGKQIEGLDSAIILTAPAMTSVLEERFEAAPQIGEDSYFTFDTYFDSIQIASEFLPTVALKINKKTDCCTASYDNIFGTL